MKKKPKKKSKAKLASIARRKKLAELSLFVRDRDKCCQICGSTKVLQNHHILPKLLYKHLMYDPGVCICLCRSCHFTKAEANGFWFTNWLMKNKLDQYNYCKDRMG